MMQHLHLQTTLNQKFQNKVRIEHGDVFPTLVPHDEYQEHLESDSNAEANQYFLLVQILKS